MNEQQFLTRHTSNQPSGSQKTSLKVALISDERYPHPATNTQQVIKNAAALASQGLNFELIIPVQWNDLLKRGYHTEDAIYAYYNVSTKLKIKQLLFLLPASTFRLEKFTHLIASLMYTSKKRFDLVYTRNEFIAIASVALGKNTVFEHYRKFGDEYPRLVRWLSKWTHKPNFLGMILHSGIAKKSMQRAGFPEEKLLVCHNGFDFADMQPMLTKTEARQILGWDSTKSFVVYTGNMQPNKGMESLVEVAALLPGVKFVLVGGTVADIERLQNFAAERQAKNLIFTGYQPIREVSKYLYAADALIIPPDSAPLEKHGRTVLPFKTFLYLAAGRPVVAPRQPDMEEVLVHEYNSLLVEPNNFAECAGAIQRLLNDSALHLKISENAAVSVKKLTWEERARKIIRWLTEVYQKTMEDKKEHVERTPAGKKQPF